MNSDIKALVARGDHLFGQRTPMLTLWEEAASQFYVERCGFTTSRYLGEDFAGHLQTSYPLIVRRELGNAIAAMLRPRDQQWGSITVDREDLIDSSGRDWLEWATGVQWRAMYDREAQFVRATKEGDNDFVTFGQCVITREINYETSTLLFRCWHLKDCAWAENASGKVDELHIHWKPRVRDLCELFPKTVHEKVKSRLAKEPYGEVNCRRIVVPSGHYAPLEAEKRRQPYVLLYVDIDNQHVLEESPRWNTGFTLPRWQTVSGSPYAYSPAVIAALPDARLIQAMTLTLLEAGEISVRPPLIGVQDVFRQDVNLYPAAITWADLEEGSKLSEVLRPVYEGRHSGMPLGLEMNQDTRNQIAAAFYLNKLALPSSDREMTAYETAQRLQEWIRAALPLFEPMEQEYNGALCEDTFDDLMRVGAFGPHDDIPDSIKGQHVRFRFESPLHENIERKKAQVFVEGLEHVKLAAEVDPASVAVMDVPGNLREALRAIGLEAKHIRDEDTVKAMAAEAAEARAAEQATLEVENAAIAAQEVGKAQQALEAAA